MFNYQAEAVMSSVAMGNSNGMVKRLKQENPQQSLFLRGMFTDYNDYLEYSPYELISEWYSRIYSE